MRKLSTLLLAGFFCLLVPGLARTEDRGFKREALLELCKSTDSIEQILCNTYLKGFNDGHNATFVFSLKRLKPEDTVRVLFYCLPPGTKDTAVIEAFIRWPGHALGDQGQIAFDASTAVSLALAEAFPCRQ